MKLVCVVHKSSFLLLCRERPQTISLVGSGEGGEGEGGTILGLPELDTDVDVS